MFVSRSLLWLRFKPVFCSPVAISREAVCFTLFDAFVTSLWVDDLVLCGLGPFLLAMIVVALEAFYVPVSVHRVLANSQPTPGSALPYSATFLGLTAASGFGSAFLREEGWLLVFRVSWARTKRQLSSLGDFARVCGAVACLSRFVLFFASSWHGQLLVLLQAVVWLVRSHHWFIRSLSDAERLHLARLGPACASKLCAAIVRFLMTCRAELSLIVLSLLLVALFPLFCFFC